MKQQLQDINYLYKINNTIVERNLLQPYQRILITVSGGQDSLCILKILYYLKKKWHWKLGILHCDHRWSNNSQLQVKHVTRLAAGMQIDYYQPVSVKSVRKETLARYWRYQIIKTIAREHKFTAIIIAHSGSDRIETLLYNVMRGTGLLGIQSINWKRNLNCIRYLLWKTKVNIPKNYVKKIVYYKMDQVIIDSKYTSCLQLIRPLLGITRSEIRILLDSWKLSSWPDLSNQILTIRRNRIRHQLIPYMRLHYNPKLDQALTRWSEIAYSENVHLTKLTSIIFSKIEVKIHNSVYKISTNGLSIEVFRSLPTVFQRTILKKFIYKHIKLALSFRYIEHIRLFFLYKKKSAFFTHNNKELTKSLLKRKYSYIYLPGKGKLLLINNIIMYFYFY